MQESNASRCHVGQLLRQPKRSSNGDGKNVARPTRILKMNRVISRRSPSYFGLGKGPGLGDKRGELISRTMQLALDFSSALLLSFTFKSPVWAANNNRTDTLDAGSLPDPHGSPFYSSQPWLTTIMQ
jgi:hypothetical protein